MCSLPCFLHSVRPSGLRLADVIYIHICQRVLVAERTALLQRVIYIHLCQCVLAERTTPPLQRGPAIFNTYCSASSAPLHTVDYLLYILVDSDCSIIDLHSRTLRLQTTLQPVTATFHTPYTTVSSCCGRIGAVPRTIMCTLCPLSSASDYTYSSALCFLFCRVLQCVALVC